MVGPPPHRKIDTSRALLHDAGSNARTIVNVIAIIPCGSKKQSVAAPAAALYTGTYFRANLAFAHSIVDPASCFILSAKHGLVRHDQVLRPYDLRLGKPGSIQRHTVAEQARELDLTDRIAVVLGGVDYFELVQGLFLAEHRVVDWMRTEGRAPGIGAQRKWLAAHHGQILIPTSILTH
jgi:hypothetical protein